jgi:orotate phosphoribosyltransferase
MKKENVAKMIKEASFLTGQFTLRSGKKSSFYWDKYRFESDPVLLQAIINELQTLLPKSYDKLAGLELGGIPLATGLSLKTGTPTLYVRKTAKTYGTCNLIEGGYEPGETAVVIEDVITTAGQVCESITKMREAGLKVEHAVCVIDRQQGGSEALEGIECSLTSLFSLQELERVP